MKKLIFALIAAATTAASAQAVGPYVGVGIANADHSYDLPGATNGSTDGYKASLKIFGGYELDQMFGVEAGYTDFRKSDFNYTLNNVRGHAESDSRAFYVAGKASAPINDQFSVFGKLGLTHNRWKLGSTTPAFNRRETDTELYAGLGAQYHLDRNIALTLEYERYGKSKDFGAKADVITVGAKYSF